MGPEDGAGAGPGGTAAGPAGAQAAVSNGHNSNRPELVSWSRGTRLPFKYWMMQRVVNRVFSEVVNRQFDTKPHRDLDLSQFRNPRSMQGDKRDYKPVQSNDHIYNIVIFNHIDIKGLLLLL